MWILFMNDMRSAKIEYIEAVARSETKEGLLSFMEGEKVETYRDGNWSKSYKQGGSLEWKNPPFDFEHDNTFLDLGTRDEFIKRSADRAAMEWDGKVEALQQV